MKVNNKSWKDIYRIYQSSTNTTN